MQRLGEPLCLFITPTPLHRVTEPILTAYLFTGITNLSLSGMPHYTRVLTNIRDL